MELDQAIEILDTLLNDYNEEPCPNEEKAIRLGLEALKRVKLDRNLPYPVISDMLPGETAPPTDSLKGG